MLQVWKIEIQRGEVDLSRIILVFFENQEKEFFLGRYGVMLGGKSWGIECKLDFSFYLFIGMGNFVQYTICIIVYVDFDFKVIQLFNDRGKNIGYCFVVYGFVDGRDGKVIFICVVYVFVDLGLVK